ncbi:MAG: hypothetical protein JO125_06445 [Chloroflexi bacterium]|nr:hypothetical protein [Chloroflexota bacterium]
MAVKPKNIEEDSWAYTLPHRIGFLIQELAKHEARELGLSKLSTSAYLERVMNQLAQEKLPQEVIEEVNTKHEQRTGERRRKAEEREKAAAKAS